MGANNQDPLSIDPAVLRVLQHGRPQPILDRMTSDQLYFSVAARAPRGIQLTGIRLLN